jgi:hypothetical protein
MKGLAIMDSLSPIFWALSGVAAIQLIGVFYVCSFIRKTLKEKKTLNREILACLKKIEDYTADNRQQALKHYDKIFEDLTNKLPALVSAQAGQQIFETESMILTRLAELDSSLKSDPESKRKMGQIITSMETLEDTVVAATSDVVRRALNEGRKQIEVEVIGNGSLQH